MLLSMKKILGGAVIIGLVGGVLFGAQQIGYADIQTALKENKIMQGIPFLSKKKLKEQAVDQITAKVATYLGMKQTDVETLMQKEKVGPRQLALASVIAKMTNKPLAEVLPQVKEKGKWKELLASSKIEPKEVWKELKQQFPHIHGKMEWVQNHPAVLFEVLGKYLGKETSEVQATLFKSKVHPTGAIHAAILSKASGKSLEEVLKLKEEKKTWKEVASALKLKEEQIQAERKKFKEQFQQIAKEWKNQFKEGQEKQGK